MANKPYVGDIGTAITLDTLEPLTEATNLSLMVLKPGAQNEIQWTASVYNVTKVRHLTEAGDFDRKGEYSAQPLLTIGTWTGRGETVKWTVYDRQK